MMFAHSNKKNIQDDFNKLFLDRARTFRITRV